MLSISMTTFAQFAGNGTIGDPYQIQTAADLAQLATVINAGTSPYSDADKHYKLINDLDLSDYGSDFNDGKGWITIGTAAPINNPFSGVFDGDNKKITGLYINNNAPQNWNMGLFGYIKNGTIKNLGVENVNIIGDNYIGGIAGTALYSEITNCYSTGNLNGKDAVGGVIGCLSQCIITDCYSTGTVNGDNRVGGIAGYVDYNCQIENCYSTGDISGDDRYVGGIAGYVVDNCQIENCYSTGDISGDSKIGGIAGDVKDNSKIENCYSIGDISGDKYDIGGIAGVATESEVNNCYSTGNINGDDGVGGIVSFIRESKITNCAALNVQLQGSIFMGRVIGYDYGGGSTLSNNIAWDGIADWGNIGADDNDGADISKEAVNADGTLDNRFTSPVWTTQDGKLPGLFGNIVEMPAHLRLSEVVYITTTTLPNGIVNTSYSATLTAVGDTPITWSIENGNLPNGLSLSPNGVIAGTPTTEGTFTFTVKATNNIGSDTKKLEITIGSVGIVETGGAPSVQVFPNPTRGEIQVTSYELQVTSVEVFDLRGHRMYIGHPTLWGGLGGLPSGIYFLRIQTENGVVVRKVVKQ